MKYQNLLRKFFAVVLICIFSFSFCDFTYATTVDTAPTIYADSAILIDARTKTILFEKNAHKQQYPASITKLMTALLAIENLQPTDIITFSKDAIYSIERGSSHIGMDVGEEITLDQALHGLLLMSANEVANGIAEKISGSIDNFAIKMTERAKELGAQNTNFVNPHGLHNPDHYTTAYDMAMITSYLYTLPYFNEIMEDITYQIPPTNKTSEIRYLSQQHGLMNPLRNSQMYRPDVVAGKTGYTDIAKHTLVTVAKKDGVSLIAVVLKSDRNTLYQDTNALLDYGFYDYESLKLHSTDSILKTLPMYTVKSGNIYQVANCNIGVPIPSTLLVQKGIKERDITTTITLPQYLDIGQVQGDTVGTISYLYGTKVLLNADLVIKDIEFLASPYPTVLPKKNNFLSFLHYYWIVVLLIILFVVVLFIYKKKHTRKPKLTFSRSKK